MRVHSFMILGGLLVATLAAPVQAQTIGGYTVLSSTVDEVVARQSIGLEAAVFGNHALLERGQQSVVLHPFFGGYGDDGTLAGVSASWHTAALLAWDVGACVGSMDADIATWTIGLSVERQALRREHSALMLQGSAAYQRMSEALGNPTAVYLDFADPDTPGDLVLLDTFQAGHVFVHAVFEADLALVRPVVDVGWVGTVYRFTASACDADLCFDAGESRVGDGFDSKVTLGIGAALGVERVNVFGGMKFGAEAVVFQLNAGIVF